MKNKNVKKDSFPKNKLRNKSLLTKNISNPSSTMSPKYHLIKKGKLYLH